MRYFLSWPFDIGLILALTGLAVWWVAKPVSYTSLGWGGFWYVDPLGIVACVFFVMAGGWLMARGISRIRRGEH